MLVHKKCHKLVSKACTSDHVEPIVKERDSHNGISNEPQQIENLPPVPDYPPEIPESGTNFNKVFFLFCFFLIGLLFTKKRKNLSYSLLLVLMSGQPMITCGK